MSHTPRGLRARLASLGSVNAQLVAGVEHLHDLYRQLMRAYLPPNVQFERERIIAGTKNPREIVFVLGLLSEGENECALLLELMNTVSAAEPGAAIDHLLDEAWYYLRTSIDDAWQLDDGPPSTYAALVYLSTILSDRLQTVRALPPAQVLAAHERPGREILLRSLRAEVAATAAGAVNEVNA